MTETIELVVKVKINYEDAKRKKEAIQWAKKCVTSSSVMGSCGAKPLSSKLLTK